MGCGSETALPQVFIFHDGTLRRLRKFLVFKCLGGVCRPPFVAPELGVSLSDLLDTGVVQGFLSG